MEKKAEKFILLDYFIIAHGKFWNSILKILLEKAAHKKTERKVVEEIPRVVEEEEIHEVAPKLEFNKKEIQSQKDQSITELNEAIMSAPEDAAKLLTSFIRE